MNKTCCPVCYKENYTVHLDRCACYECGAVFNYDELIINPDPTCRITYNIKQLVKFVTKNSDEEDIEEQKYIFDLMNNFITKLLVIGNEKIDNVLKNYKIDEIENEINKEFDF